MKKYEFTEETKTLPGGTIVHRIRALRDFAPPQMDGCVHAGDLGGFIEKEENLSHDGNCWVDEEAIVRGSAIVRDNAYVCLEAQVYHDAIISEDACVTDSAHVYGDTIMGGEAVVRGQSRVSGTITLRGAAQVEDVDLSVMVQEIEGPNGEVRFQQERVTIEGDLLCYPVEGD